MTSVSLSASVCGGVCALKGKRLELSTPNSVDIHRAPVVARHALTLMSNGQRSRSRTHATICESKLKVHSHHIKVTCSSCIIHCYNMPLNRDSRQDTAHRARAHLHLTREIINRSNKKRLKNVGPIRHCELPYALILHCHSPGVATVARRLRIDVHDNNDNA